MQFEDITHEKWLERIKKELKTDDLASKNVRYGSIELDPFFERSSDVDAGFRCEKQWQIKEVFDATLHTNSDILKALQGGCNYIELQKANEIIEPSHLFKDVVLEFIQLHLHCSEGKAVNSSLIDFIDNLSEVDRSHVSVSCGNLDSRQPLYRYRFSMKWNPDVVTEMTRIFTEVIERLDHAIDEGKRLKVGQSLQLERSLTSNIIYELAILRALKMVWLQIENGFDSKIPAPEFHAICDGRLENEDIEQIYIAQSLLGLTAALAGYDVINIAQASTEKNDFHRRMSRNVHHLLMMESFVDKANQGFLGSYQIETLAIQLASEVWKNIGRE